MRRFTTILLAAPLALGLTHCAADDAAEFLESDPLAQQATSDASVPPVDAGTRVDASIPSLDAGTTVAVPFAITSSVVKDGEYIPGDYRCPKSSPPLSWTEGPAQTQSYAIVFKDNGNGFYHWTIFDIPVSERGLPAGVPIGATLQAPKGAKQARNWSSSAGYGGPCAGEGKYGFTLYALDVAALPGVTAQTSAANVLKAIEAHDLASTQLNVKSRR